MTTATETMATKETGAAASPAHPANWGPAKKALALTLALRLFYSLAAALMSPILFLNQDQINRTLLTEHLMQRGEHPVMYALFGVWERFDTLWYIHIANQGYDLVRSAVFYPLYPALIRVFSFFTHWDLLSTLLITNTATFFFFWGALRLFELGTSPRTAFRAVLLWALFPDGFIFFSGYPDSLLLALTLWSIYFASRRGWAMAGLLGLIAGCAKAFGCLTLVPILYFGWRYRDWKAVPAAGITVAGAAAFQVWLMANHFPSTARIYEMYWQTTTSMPWTTVGAALWRLAHGEDSLLLLNFGMLVLVLAAGYLAKVPLEYRIYSAAAFCMISTKNTDPVFQSSVRYSLVLFAAFPAVSRKLARDFDFTALLLSALVVNLFLMRVYLDWGLVV
jgi:hypothetical protein